MILDDVQYRIGLLNPNLLPRRWKMAQKYLRLAQNLRTWYESQWAISLQGICRDIRKKTYVCHSCVQSKDVSEEATQFRKLNSFPNENHSHQNLHKELLLSYKRGLLLEEKPELHRVLEQRRLEQHRAQERALHPPSDLEQELYKRQQKLQEYENEKMKCAEGKKNIPEFVLVKEKLRHISEQNG